MYGKSETCDMHIWQANKMFSYIMHEKEIWKNKLSVHTSSTNFINCNKKNNRNWRILYAVWTNYYINIYMIVMYKKTKQDVYRPWWSPESHSPYTDLSEGVIFAFQDLFWSSNPKPKLCYLCILKLIFKTKIIHKEGTGSEEASKRKIWL